MMSNRFYSNSRGKTGIKTAHDPPATKKYMPEQPLTRAFQLPASNLNLLS
jgi:hypothetical protein